ncbi:histone acetyltransferase type B catalytic subunit [Auriculariales sp. MPI-PUGE-AT-0066]|nr:histone acetyltransferase type B catalytic subunit [Auriculariales sp. MPI-PUGE-AT-0066]
MATEDSPWACNANDALAIQVVRAHDDKTSLATEQPFHPLFTYPIYGEEEKIYGYKDLKIDLRVASGSLATYFAVSHSAKLAAGTVDDAEGKLKDKLSTDICRSEDEFSSRVEQDALSFRPPGRKIASYVRAAELSKGKGRVNATTSEDDDNAVVYEVYHATWSTPGFTEYHRRMQLFILLLIEGGSYLNEDEDKWEFVLLFERRRRSDTARTAVYHFIGYSSLYPFFYFPDKVRMRLSQFIILPPYQKQGHGSELYEAIYVYVLGHPDIAELSVEDPAEAFEDLRDKCDLNMLLAHESFMAEASGIVPATLSNSAVPSKGKPGAKRSRRPRTALGPPTDRAWAEQWRLRLKLASRQYHRLIEMLILRSIGPNNEKGMRAYRLQVKERLYRFNYEIMVQMEKEERLEKLEETFQNVREDYQRILAHVR